MVTVKIRVSSRVSFVFFLVFHNFYILNPIKKLSGFQIAVWFEPFGHAISAISEQYLICPFKNHLDLYCRYNGITIHAPRVFQMT